MAILNVRYLNGMFPPVGTLLPGIEPYVVRAHTDTGVELITAQTRHYLMANSRKPAEVHSVYEHNLIPPRRTVFGLARVMG